MAQGKNFQPRRAGQRQRPSWAATSCSSVCLWPPTATRRAQKTALAARHHQARAPLAAVVVVAEPRGWGPGLSTPALNPSEERTVGTLQKKTFKQLTRSD
jgi:hypothetical protein